MRARPEVTGWLSRLVCRHVPPGTRSRQNVTRAPRPQPRSTVSPPAVTCPSSSRPDQMPTLAPPGRHRPRVANRLRTGTAAYRDAAIPKPAFRAERPRRGDLRRGPSAVVRSASEAIDHDAASVHRLRTPADAHAHQPIGLERQPTAGVPRRCDEVAHGQAEPGPADVGHHAQVGVELRLAVESRSSASSRARSLPRLRRVETAAPAPTRRSVPSRPPRRPRSTAPA